MNLYANIRHIPAIKAVPPVFRHSLTPGHSLLFLGDREAILPVDQTTVFDSTLSLNGYPIHH